MKHTILRGLLVGALIGIVIPLVFLGIQHVFGGVLVAKGLSYHFHRVMRVVWPLSTWLMATGGIEGTTKDLMFVIAAVLGNTVLYSAVGGVLLGGMYLIKTRIVR